MTRKTPWWKGLSFSTKTGPRPVDRKGAIRQSDIPAKVLSRLNQGKDETKTLVEWLAVDQAKLFSVAAKALKLKVSESQIRAVRAAGREKITRRLKKMGEIWREILEKHPHSGKIFEILAFHESDLVRTWAIFALRAEAKIPLSNRLLYMKIFAADRNMGVRECAWDGFRPFLSSDLDKGLAQLKNWVTDKNDAVRRCAIEGTRPRGVWTEHLEPLKQQPEKALFLLEPVKKDPSLYVRKAVANWLNDASKSQPRWVVSLLKKWNNASPAEETRWITGRALRTIQKNQI